MLAWVRTGYAIAQMWPVARLGIVIGIITGVVLVLESVLALKLGVALRRFSLAMLLTATGQVLLGMYLGQEWSVVLGAMVLVAMPALILVFWRVGKFANSNLR